MSIRQINQSHRYSNVKYIVKSHNMFGIYHRMRFRCALSGHKDDKALCETGIWYLFHMSKMHFSTHDETTGSS